MLNANQIVRGVFALALVLIWFLPLYVADAGVRSAWDLSGEHPALWAAPAIGAVFVWSVVTARYRVQLASLLALALFVDVVLT